MSELLTLAGEGETIGDMQAEELAGLVGKPSFSLRLPDGRLIVLIGMTRDETRACLPGLFAPARITVSAV